MAKGFRINCGVLKKYTGESTDIVIPEGVESTVEGVFEYPWRIKSIEFPTTFESFYGYIDLDDWLSLEKVIIKKEHFMFDAYKLFGISKNIKDDSCKKRNMKIRIDRINSILDNEVEIISEGVNISSNLETMLLDYTKEYELFIAAEEEEKKRQEEEKAEQEGAKKFTIFLLIGVFLFFFIVRLLSC